MGDQIVWSDPPVLNLQTERPVSHYRVKGCFLSSVGVVGLRLTGFAIGEAGRGSGAPDNTRFIVLSDPESGRPLAIIDEHWTYSVRTVAAAALAAKLLAREDARSMGLVGTGNLARVALPLFCRLFELKEVRVTSRREESRKAFAAEMNRSVSVPVLPVDSVREAVEGSDLVLTCTSANARLVESHWLARGAFVCALGRGELADEVYREADKVVVDSWEMSQDSADVRELIRSGVISRERLYAELGEIVVGYKPGRESHSEKIVARIEGLASQDILIAYRVVERAKSRGLGTILPAGI
jgi:ornithine cyclodeaminase